MTDLEMTLATAELMQVSLMGSHCPVWNPLKDDAQAMALFKRFAGECLDSLVVHYHNAPVIDLNRAIVECVAKMQVEPA